MNELTSIFKLLSDDTRLRMILLLFQQELCVCQISGILDVPQPRVSKNLAKLRDMGLVTDQRQEKFVYYALKQEDTLLHRLLKDLLETAPVNPQILADASRLASKEKYLTQCYSLNQLE